MFGQAKHWVTGVTTQGIVKSPFVEKVDLTAYLPKFRFAAPGVSRDKKMMGTQVNVAPLTCKLSNLTVFTTDPHAEYPETILSQDEPFSLRVTVEFGGSGAIALVPLCLSIQVNFFAEPCGLGSKVELGHTSVDTSARMFTYAPTLTVATPATVGLASEEIYQITAVLRAGAANSPALITGFIEGLIVQTYS